jgi:hypothetical protein
MNARRTCALAQGAFFTSMGLWPIASMRTFELVLGRKRDRWLVNTVGLLLASIGAALGLAARRDRVTPELALAGAATAATLAGIDLVYVARGRISKMYLADAAAELAIVGGWAASLRR